LSPLEKYLVGHGFDELAAGAWAKFLDTVFDALRDAETIVKSPAYWSIYRTKQGAFLRQTEGKEFRLPAEEGLTHALYECLWKVKVRSQPGHPLRDLSIEFHSEAKLPSRKRTGKRARRTDIWARSSMYENAPEIVFEAKLINKSADIRRYLGDAGLGRFLDSKDPYTRKPLGGLLAYTIEGTREDWMQRIREEMLGPPAIALSQDQITIGAKSEKFMCNRVSRPLLQLDPIAIFHIVMKFASDPQMSTPPAAA
jgi:hypothetical protein